MKKYVCGFLFFLIMTSGSLAGLFWLTAKQPDYQIKEVQATESIEQPIFAEENKDEPIRVVLNQASVQAETKSEKYCLTLEEGYLIIYDQAENEIDLITHMPIAEFPMIEQERLMEGIWFRTMYDLFSYLESCTS